MTNMQFYFALGVPFFTVVLMYVAGILSNRSAVNDLRSEMRGSVNNLRSEMRGAVNDLRSEMRAGFTDIAYRFSDLLRSDRGAVNDLRSEMRAGFTDIAYRFSDLSSRMDREKRLDTIDTEIRISHDHRLAVLEARVLDRAS